MPATRAARSGRLGRATVAILLAILAVVLFSGAALAAQPVPNDTASPAPPRLAWMRNLAGPDTYVGQYTYYECVAASIQMMLNMVNAEADHSAATQHAIWLQAHNLSKYNGDGGADPYGWARELSASGSPYGVYGGTSLSDSIHVLARAMAQSGRPGGITVYSGGHAWVISGILASNNPALTNDFSVLKVSVIDPLWTLHRGGSGSVAPETWLTLAQLTSRFTPYHDPRRAPAIEGRYVAIVPSPTATELANLANTRTVFGRGNTGATVIGSNRIQSQP